jgi:hypothetical protein
MKKAVFCLCRDHQASQIIEQLLAQGIPEANISVLYSDASKKNEFKSQTLGEGYERPYREDTSVGGLGYEKHSKAAEGAATGGTAGGLIGGTLGLLAGIGALAIPGMGPFIAAGPILAALAGSAVGGSIGLLTGALVGLGIPEYEAVHFAERLKDANTILISVHTDSHDEVERIKKIFDKNGAEDIACNREVVSSVKKHH